MPELSSHPTIRVIGVGGGGIEVHEGLEADLPPWMESMAVDFASEIPKGCRVVKACALELPRQRGLCGPSPELIQEAGRLKLPEIERFVEGAELVIPAAGLGGMTGTVADRSFTMRRKRD